MSAADLIADARDRAETLRRMFPDDGEVRDDTRLIDRLADALEAVIANRDEFRAAWNVLGFKIDRLEDERDAARAVIEKAREAVKSGSRMDANPTRLGGPPECMEGEMWWQSWHLQADAAWRRNMTEVLSSVPADVLRERDRRVRAEALREAANELEERWTTYSVGVQTHPAGAATISPQGSARTGQEFAKVLRARADRIEQNSEGNET